MRLHKSIAVFSGLMLAGSAWTAEMTDEQVRERIVRDSVTSFSGSCACPESTDAAGRRCGERSAHSKPGGVKPLCYTHEVSDQQVREFRQRH